MPRAWSRPVATAALVLLAALAAVAAARGRAAWAPAGALPSPSPAGTDLARAPAAPPPRAARPPRPLAGPDPTRLVADVAEAGAPRPRTVVLPAGARLADLLAAAGLPADLPVAGAPPAGRPLPDGRRLVVAAGGTARLEAMAADRRLRLGIPLDLNADDAAALERLPGVGPATAARIVADRARRGPFASVADLDRVRGIGPATVARVRPFVTAGTAGGVRPGAGDPGAPTRDRFR